MEIMLAFTTVDCSTRTAAGENREGDLSASIAGLSNYVRSELLRLSFAAVLLQKPTHSPQFSLDEIVGKDTSGC